MWLNGSNIRGETMSNKSKAKSFLSDLLGDEELKQVQEEVTTTPQTDSSEQFIVYFKGDKPDCVWQYFHNPDDGLEILNEDGTPTGKRAGYGRQFGYWDDDEDNKGSRKFKEHKSNNLKLMDFETFMDRVPPNKDCTKIFDSEADFLLELI